MIVGKPGSYLIAVAGRDFEDDADLPEDTVYFWFRTEYVFFRGADKGGGGAVGYQILPDKFPIRRWVHVALQIADRHDGAFGRPFYDGANKGNAGISNNGPIRQTELPLFIGGGSKSATFKGESVWATGDFTNP